MCLRDPMKPYAYTIVVKGDYTSEGLTRLVKEKLGLPCNVVIARVNGGEILAVVHVADDSSLYGRALANWLGEMPHFAPYPSGSLLWYR